MEAIDFTSLSRKELQASYLPATLRNQVTVEKQILETSRKNLRKTRSPFQCKAYTRFLCAASQKGEYSNLIKGKNWKPDYNRSVGTNSSRNWEEKARQKKLKLQSKRQR